MDSGDVGKQIEIIYQAKVEILVHSPVGQAVKRVLRTTECEVGCGPSAGLVRVGLVIQLGIDRSSPEVVCDPENGLDCLIFIVYVVIVSHRKRLFAVVLASKG